MKFARAFPVRAWALGLCLLTSPAWALDNSTITAAELDRVYGAIDKDNWGAVEKAVAPLIQRTSAPQRYLIARLRYIYIMSLEKQVERGKLKYADLRNKLSLVENQLVTQPWHPVSASSETCFNQICPDPEKGPSVLYTAQADEHATQIYSFEYFDMGAPIDISSFKGENARLGGILEKIEINENLPLAERSGAGVTWYLRLKWKEGFIDYER